MFNNVGIALVYSVEDLQEWVRVDWIGDNGRGLQLLRDSIGVSEEDESLRELFAQPWQRRLLFQQMLTCSVKRSTLSGDKLVLRG